MTRWRFLDLVAGAVALALLASLSCAHSPLPRAREQLTVGVVTPALEELYGDTYRDAMRGMNAMIGCEVFVWSSSPRISIQSDATRGPNPDAHAELYHWPDGRKTIYVRTPGSSGEEYLSLQHELGHALGLQHGEGIMRESVVSMGWNSARMTHGAVFPLPVLSEEDAAAVRARYCPER